MQILIMRHGEAHFDAPNDSERKLTSTGQTATLKVANWLVTKTQGIKYVLVSPYTRAQQTLAIIRNILPLSTKAETLSELTPNGDEDYVVSYLQALAHIEHIDSVLIVSHLPLVGDIFRLLCPQQLSPLFYPSTVACIDYDPVKQIGEFQWVYHSEF